jgi:Putative serine esterase (DUF676)
VNAATVGFLTRLWGTVNHWNYVANQLGEKGAFIHDNVEESVPKGYNVVVYRTSSHPGYFTYDGVDVCGTRVAVEILDEANRLNVEGVSKVTKISVTGYSLGGLIARYAVGLLHKKRFFEDIEPVTFTTFCTPHVGTRVLGSGHAVGLFNSIGTYALSSTSQQLFLKDNYHAGGVPLLQHMSDPKSIYYQALAKFSKRVSYANTEGDNRCAYYTAAFDRQDPFDGRGKFLQGPYALGYEPTVLDSSKGVFQFSDSGQSEKNLSFGSKLVRFGKTTIKRVIALFKVIVVVPVWFVAFLINATYQHILSVGRVKKFRTTVYDEWEHGSGPTFEERLEDQADVVVDTVYKSLSKHNESTLKLSPVQQSIIEGLNALEWHKYPIHITLHPHVHAAAIVRYKHERFEEGKVVVRHWIEEGLIECW